MNDATFRVKLLKVAGLATSIIAGVTLAVQGQVETGVGLIAAALSSAGINSVQAN